MYYIYILRCQDDSLYTGSTPDLFRRIQQHCGKKSGGAKYTHSHPPIALLGLWVAPDRGSAVRFETYCKQLSRQKKLALLASPHQWQILVPKAASLEIEAISPKPLEYYLEQHKKG